MASHTGEWSTGLCDCCKDCSSCCLTWCCPCISFGRIAEVVDKGIVSCCASGSLYFLLMFTGFECFYSCTYRTKLRKQYLLPKKPCNDCLVHCFCKPCALCQEYRELKYRGFNPSHGWQENISRESQGVVMAPVDPEQMKR